jgi:hypothetical protein
MTSKLKANILKDAVSTARDIAANDATKGDLANTLLKSVHAAREAGLTVNTVWAEIARDMGLADKEAKIEGATMTGTLAVYRSTMRKGAKVNANFALSWGLFKSDIARLAKPERAPQVSKENQPKETGEAETGTKETKLADIAVPAALVRAIADKRMGLAIEKRIAFDAKISAWIASYGV